MKKVGKGEASPMALEEGLSGESGEIAYSENASESFSIS